MNIFREIIDLGFEQVVFCHDRESGLKAVVAIHSTKAGPALGGCRMRAYMSEDEMIADALRLARGMTYKAAVYGLKYGGGKAVIWGSPATDKNPDKFHALGRFIEGLNGRYITGLDMGTTVSDMDVIRLETRHVTDTSGSIMAKGDFTAEMTAYGVYLGIKAAVKHRLGCDGVGGLTVAVQGLGKVGWRLCSYLHEAGAKLFISDLNKEAAAAAVRIFGAQQVPPDRIWMQACDVFAPCALGGILNDRTIPKLCCAVVAGAANNQLGLERHADLLQERNILYVPDYVINAGGIIITAGELDGGKEEELRSSVEAVQPMLLNLFRMAKDEGITALTAANRLAEQAL
ncbi:Leu/Phe/Val dehydrogenase [Paenibacillus beijingensis]|uniref:Glutamate/phenylalanine/leucine/valine/L-tryptophan dehydrogenase C-terminal domain-containing protein n=1 Tax=Paenibacillus beijingensis TaxID=1126833 RepID=A0A0D5NIB4_9BACL|nr:amino acid dehydrogenase [Paenibacillus beijingensis]AJY74648.1 hypothetical protein VN24_08750 [Paenibacillus beijingensis]